jgi:hypothetical protein
VRRRLPLGIQDFSKIREDGFAYVENTETETFIPDCPNGEVRASFADLTAGNIS